MKKQIGIFINLKKHDALNVLYEFFSKIKSLKFNFAIQESLSKKIPNIPGHINMIPDKKMFSDCELIVAFGGDGTILRTVHLVGKNEIPILGVNIGSLGFLAATSLENIIDHINQYFNNELSIDRRSVLELNIIGQSEKWFALNEFVIDKAGFHRVIKIETKIDDHLLNSYISDGLIISTPTGSTAYSLANGGPIVLPSKSAVFIVNPICPHTLSNRPVVIPDSTIIELEVQSELKKYQLICDGQSLGNYTVEKVMRIRRANFDVSLVIVPENDFYATLRTKLGWGEDFRNKNRWSK
jgi:NAD+ kinase